jgi:hypothetical protein
MKTERQAGMKRSAIPAQSQQTPQTALMNKTRKLKNKSCPRLLCNDFRYKTL